MISAWKKRAVALALATSAVTGTGLAASVPAHAGQHGQQIYVNTYYMANALLGGDLVIQGYNQNGQWTSSPVVPLPIYRNENFRVTNWWWQGRVMMHWYRSDGSLYATTTANVPVSQGSNDYGVSAPSCPGHC